MVSLVVWRGRLCLMESTLRCRFTCGLSRLSIQRSELRPEAFVFWRGWHFGGGRPSGYRQNVVGDSAVNQ